jgi:hypothetical protein
MAILISPHRSIVETSNTHHVRHAATQLGELVLTIPSLACGFLILPSLCDTAAEAKPFRDHHYFPPQAR